MSDGITDAGRAYNEYMFRKPAVPISPALAELVEAGVKAPLVVYGIRRWMRRIHGQWHIEDGDDGWYVVRPWDQGRCGPFTEEEAVRQLPILQAQYPAQEGREP